MPYTLRVELIEVTGEYAILDSQALVIFTESGIIGEFVYKCDCGKYKILEKIRSKTLPCMVMGTS